jgi:hypothetical protein
MDSTMGPADVYKHNRIGRTASGIAPTRCSCAVKSGCSPLALTRAWTVCLIANPQQVFPPAKLTLEVARLKTANKNLRARLAAMVRYHEDEMRRNGKMPCRSLLFALSSNACIPIARRARRNASTPASCSTIWLTQPTRSYRGSLELGGGQSHRPSFAFDAKPSPATERA